LRAGTIRRNNVAALRGVFQLRWNTSIRDGSRAIFECLSILFTSDRRTALPNLKSLSISFRGGDLYGSAAWQELAKIASERGVELKTFRSK
jgi:hypothetical protein